MKIIIPTIESIIFTNQFVCRENGQKSHLLNQSKIESALHTAFYPGSEPFNEGGVAKLAGALCFYLSKAHAFMDGNKRTATLSAIMFMNLNEYELNYPNNSEDEYSDLAKIVNQATAGEISKDQLLEWFERHKTKMS